MNGHSCIKTPLLLKWTTAHSLMTASIGFKFPTALLRELANSKWKINATEEEVN